MTTPSHEAAGELTQVPIQPERLGHTALDGAVGQDSLRGTQELREGLDGALQEYVYVADRWQRLVRYIDPRQPLEAEMAGYRYELPAVCTERRERIYPGGMHKEWRIYLEVSVTDVPQRPSDEYLASHAITAYEGGDYRAFFVSAVEGDDKTDMGSMQDTDRDAHDILSYTLNHASELRNATAVFDMFGEHSEWTEDRCMALTTVLRRHTAAGLGLLRQYLAALTDVGLNPYLASKFRDAWEAIDFPKPKTIELKAPSGPSTLTYSGSEGFE